MQETVGRTLRRMHTVSVHSIDAGFKKGAEELGMTIFLFETGLRS